MSSFSGSGSELGASAGLLSEGVRPALPVGGAQLKRCLRAGLDSQTSRRHWWPALPGLSSYSSEDLANLVLDADPDCIGTAVRLREMLPEPLLDYEFGNETPTLGSLSTGSMSPSRKESELTFIEQGARRLEQVLVQRDKVAADEVQYWLPLARLLLWQIRRVDVVYVALGSIMSQTERYFSPTPKGLHVIFYSFREMLRSFMPKTHSALKEIGALEDKYLSMMFVDFFAELFPPHLLLPLMDAYLLEGVKILHRYGLALIAGYKGRVKVREFKSARDFWLAIKADGASAAASANSAMAGRVLGLEEVLPAIDAFILKERARNQAYFLSGLLKENAFGVGRSIVARLSRPMAVSRTNIKALEQAAGLVEDRDISKTVTRRSSFSQSKSVAEKVLDGRGRMSFTSRSSSQGPQWNSPNISPTKNGSDKRPALSQLQSSVSPTEVEDLRMEIASLVEQSELLSSAQAEVLLSCLPENIAISGLELIFASRTNGHSFTALHAQAKDLSPIVLLCRPVIRSDNEKEDDFDGVIIGAVINDSISPPDVARVRGDGKTTRVFVVGSEKDRETSKLPASVVLDWAANHDDKLLKRALNPARDDESDKSASFIAALNQFCVSADDYLSFGGSVEAASNCIRIDESLNSIVLGVSDTFGNKLPLLPAADASNKSESKFLIRDLEVFCGKSAKSQAVKRGMFAEKSSILGDKEADDSR